MHCHAITNYPVNKLHIWLHILVSVLSEIAHIAMIRQLPGNPHLYSITQHATLNVQTAQKVFVVSTDHINVINEEGTDGLLHNLLAVDLGNQVILVENQCLAFISLLVEIYHDTQHINHRIRTIMVPQNTNAGY